jgi:ribonuclease HI
MPELPNLSNSWTIYVDGSKCVLGAGAGVVLMSPQGDKMSYILHMRFANPLNNEAEYEVVLHGMCMAKACGTTRIKIHDDSNLIT